MNPKKKAGAAPAAHIVAPLRISYPFLWLALAILVVYAPSLQFGFTELDDSIFIRELHTYNEDLTNLVTSFHRGVFDAVNDTYYRPLFLDSMILNYKMSGQEILGYHLINLLLHLLTTFLLYRLFLKLGLRELHAFLFSLVFAIHPVLSQAVVWIPGRNDTLLAVFVLPFFLTAVSYAEKPRPGVLLLSLLFLVCAFFTKESALFAPAVAFLLLTLVLGKSWKSRSSLMQYGIWVAALVIYFAVRSTATLKHNLLDPGQVLHDFFGRLPVVVQYLGKIFFPFNLSVFPVQQDTVYYFGLAALVLLVVIIAMTRERNTRVIIAGILWFLIFLLPVLFVPNSLSEQTFEHRLYLPLMGILLALSQTRLVRNKWKEWHLLYAFLGVAAIFSIINNRHQQHFKDPLSFWEQAAETSPHSAYALMMYGARVENKQEGYALMRQAYALNPKEKYLNYYYGVMLQNQDSILWSEKHFLEEQKISDYFECDFYLAKVDFEKKDFPAAIRHLERYVSRDSLNGPGNNNLLLLYLQTQQKQKALKQIERMRTAGLPVPQDAIRQAEQMN